MQNPDYFNYSNNLNQLQQAYNQHLYLQHKRKVERNELIRTGLIIGATILSSFIIMSAVLAVIMVVYREKFNDLYSNSALFQSSLNIIVVDVFSLMLPFTVMSLILKRRYTTELVPRKKIGKMPAFAWVCVGMGCCVLANFITAGVIALFKEAGYKLNQPELASPSNVLECVAAVFATAIAPALFEEYAMRCCTLGALRKYGKGFAVFTVSIVFGLIHSNVIQFVFAFLLGLVFGYITVLTDNIVPAILIHALNNGMSVTSDIIKFAAGTKFADYTGTALYIVWSVLAIWGLVYLLRNKLLLPPKKGANVINPYSLSFGTKLLCLLPGFIIPFALLIYFTSTTVVPI